MYVITECTFVNLEMDRVIFSAYFPLQLDLLQCNQCRRWHMYWRWHAMPIKQQLTVVSAIDIRGFWSGASQVLRSKCS